MKKLKSFLSASKANVAIFVLVVALILTATIGAASAAYTYFAETYSSRVQRFDIGVSLMENGERISWRDYIAQDDSQWDEYVGTLLTNMIPKGESFSLGKPYDERLSVRNSGTINEYVRVTIFTYWVDAETGEKQINLNPDYINLKILCDAYGSNNGWLLDESASTTERTVLYYNRLLYSEIDDSNRATETPAFSEELTISSDVYGYADDYNGKKFMVEVKVDAVQEQNAQSAAASAWGTNIVINEEAGTLSLR